MDYNVNCMDKLQNFIESIIAIVLLFILSPVTILLVLLVKLSSKGPVIHWSDRVGKENKIFSMPKFRTMIIKTPQVASHTLENPSNFYTPIGNILRKYSLDEIPQLTSIVKGDMRFVGPRPALFNQADLINLRQELGIHKLTPGITGWAQVNGRDEISVNLKVQLDQEYLNRKSIKFDLYILFLTFYKVLRKEGISH